MPDECLKITGYHGTLKSRATRICKEGFKESKKRTEWLGYGVYFFEKFSHARNWATREHDRQDTDQSEPVVLIADIRVPPSSFLDLDNRDVMRAFQDELKRISSLTFQENPLGAPKFKDEKEARCFFCNLYRGTHPETKVLAFTFVRDIHYNEFGFPHAYGQRQLCVADHTCIKMPLRMEVV